MSVQVATDRPMPEVAGACIASMLAGHDVELAVAPWRRPGLAQAIGAELDAIGHQAGTGTWSFTDPDVQGQPVQLDGGDILGWGAPVDAPVAAGPALMAPVAAQPPAYALPERSPDAYVRPEAPTPGVFGDPQAPGADLAATSLQASGMMLAAYAVLALAQPVMAAGLRPGPFGRPARGAPMISSRRSSQAAALAELADLDY